ncbi:MFS transporter [Pleurocapsales cyanobacterium LEGE 06147]|nr:MFS transporter [Pleurocapsales cyanobacterium LEGE 06147]
MIKKTNLSKFVLLGCLYVSQYIPIAFFYQALPVFLRQRGVALNAIGLLPLISLPWMLKFLWSPLVDRYSFNPEEHYRPWILGCQSLLALTLILCAFLNIEQNIAAIIFSLFLVCFFAATQDIATDALAIGLLSPDERGLGNGIQSAGNYFGAIIGGGGMLVLLNRLGWQISLAVLAILILLASIPIWLHQDKLNLVQWLKSPTFLLCLASVVGKECGFGC